ncbi:MAG: PD40 domain-containing protein [candidate division Zixibacteria bacterium]|nr:PD40 domain-containing protein [candidate division Zixibacteria bacterium]
MRLINLIFVLLIVAVTISSCIERVKDDSEIRGDYLGQSLESDSADLFAPKLVNTGLNERDMTIAPDGNEILYSLVCGDQGVIIQILREDSIWGKPQIAPFSGQFSDFEPCISPDGQKLYFASQRPINGTNAKDFDIWVCDKIEQGWSKPVNLGAPINTINNEFYPSITSDGTIYFTAGYESHNNTDDIYRSKIVNGKFSEVELLPDPVNSLSYEYNAFISPDESYLIYTAHDREGSQGRGDLYINFRNADDTWSEAINLGGKVNSPANELCPFVTRDGKYLFFTSAKTTVSLQAEPTLTIDRLKARLNGSGNGGQDIYWIKADFLDGLRK